VTDDGASCVREVKQAVRRHVRETVGQVYPTDRKFCPTNKAIRNHMALANRVLGQASDDQSSLQAFVSRFTTASFVKHTIL